MQGVARTWAIQASIIRDTLIEQSDQDKSVSVINKEVKLVEGEDQGHSQEGGWVGRTPLSEAESFKTKKSHQILQPWSCPVATCTLALLCATLEGRIALMQLLNKSSRSITSHDQ